MRTPLQRSDADAEDFDRSMRAAIQCGRVDYASLSGPDLELLLTYWSLVQSEVEDTRKAIELGLGTDESPVYVDFFDAPIANAIVTSREYGGHWIGISSGAHRLVTFALGQLFRHSGLLVDLGDPTREIHGGPLVVLGGTLFAPDEPAPVQAWTWTPTLSDLLPDAKREPANVKTALRPLDPLREFAYTVCLTMFFQYLGLHELGHIHKRHLSLLGARGARAAFFGESATPVRPGLAALEYQALEHEADAWAALQMLGKWAHQGNFVMLRPFPHRDEFDANDPRLHLRLWFITQNVFAWIFGRKADLEQYDNATHPHPDVRFRMLFAHMVGSGGALLSEQRQQLLWATKDQIIADAVGLRATLIDFDALIDGSRMPNLDDEHYSQALHERITALSFASAALAGELGAAGTSRQSGTWEGASATLELAQVRQRAWDERWRKALRAQPPAPVEAGNLEWQIPEHRAYEVGTDIAASAPLDVQTGGLLQLSLLCWSVACPDASANGRWLPEVWRSDLWPALMATGQQHLLAWADADPNALASRPIQAWAEAWLAFLGAAFTASTRLGEAAAPWSVPELYERAPTPRAAPPWLFLTLHQQLSTWRRAATRANSPVQPPTGDVFVDWLREWDRIDAGSQADSGDAGDSLAKLLLTAPWSLLSPPENDFIAAVCSLVGQVGMSVFGVPAAGELGAAGRLGPAVEAVSYLAAADRALQDTRRPFIAFTNLVNRLSLRCCVRVALWGEAPQALLRCPSLDERARAAVIRARSALGATGTLELPLESWLRQWTGGLPNFERRCLGSLRDDIAGFDTVANALCAALGDMANQYRALEPQDRGACPVFQAVDAWGQDARHPMHASAMAARRFLHAGTADAVRAYLAAWRWRYEDIEQKVIHDNLAHTLQTLADASPGLRARFVWPDATTARAALRES